MGARPLSRSTPRDGAVLALDIGGTKLAGAIVREDGSIHSERQVPTPAAGSAEQVFQALVELGGHLLEGAGSAIWAVGAGCGGPMLYPAGIVSPINIPGWRAFPLKERLMSAFLLPVVVDNDAKAFAVGEHRHGAAQGVANVLGMVVSTGVGGGVILDGELVHGGHGNAGHIGHAIVAPGGPRCSCGARGCVEALASGTGIARRIRCAVLHGEDTVVGQGATAMDAAAAARREDVLTRRLFREAGEGLGIGIANAAALLDIELVVLGGSIALHAWDLIGPTLETTLRDCAQLSFTRNLPVRVAVLGNQAGLVGAAALAFEEAGRR